MRVFFAETIEETESILKDSNITEFIAGGTDVQDRVNSGILKGNLLNISGVDELRGISVEDGYYRIGALTTISEISKNKNLKEYEGLLKALRIIANPQVRNVATIGGNILQKNRCWYFRNPHFKCLKKGGDKCFAREGDNRYHAIFQKGACVTVHASTLAMILKAYAASVELSDGNILSIDELLGDGSDPTRDNKFPKGKLLAAVHLPKIPRPEKSKYFRLIKRELGEWPTIELFGRTIVERDVIKEIVLTAGAVANIPIRLTEVEDLLKNEKLNKDLFFEAVDISVKDAQPLEKNKYKIPMFKNSLLNLFTQLFGDYS